MRTLNIVTAAKRSVLVIMGISALVGASTVWGRAAVIEETAKINAVHSEYQIEGPIQVDGNDILAVGYGRFEDVPGRYGVFHFERQADGSWLSRGLIASLPENFYPNVNLSLDDGIAAFTADYRQGLILERTATGWNTVPLVLPQEFASDVRVVDGTIAIGAERGGDTVVVLMRKNASGVWAETNLLPGTPTFGDGDVWGPAALEYTGTQVALVGYYDFDLEDRPETHIYDLIGGQWHRTSILPSWHTPYALNGEIHLSSWDNREPGELLLLERRDTSGAWTLRTSLISEESAANYSNALYGFWHQAEVVSEGNRVYVPAQLSDLRGEDRGAVSVLLRNGQGNYIHTATLVPSDLGFGLEKFGNALAADGNRVAMAARSAVDDTGQGDRFIYVFDLPATLPQPLRVQDTFEDINSAGWTPAGATTWSVVSSSGSYLYRQTNVTGDARAILDAPVARDQAIEADVTVRSFPGASSWAGLVVRYADSMNFYYLLARNGTLQIRRMQNGIFGPIASVPFAMTTGRTYRMRLEAIGSQLRAYVNGNEVLSALDKSLPQGRAGLTMYKSSVDYDNVVVTNSPRVALLEDTFSHTSEESRTPWTTSPAAVWSHAQSNGEPVFRQTTEEGDARAVNGAPAADQIVSADIRPTTFHPAGTGWVGLMARYQDDRNYYYVLLKNNGRAALRKLVDGRTTLFEEVSFPVTTGATYRTRLEVIGNTLRLYVNDQLLAEGQDSTFPTGRYGLVTYRGAADFDNFSVAQP